jgi:4-hydroxy-3-methylbut-2-enyl diphosphate reductase
VRAIEIVELALRKYGPPVYVRHEIVHNKRVVEELRQKGAIFVEELTEIPDDAITVFSAHGVSQQVADDAEYRNLPVIDATCPLVAKVHKEGQRYAARDYDVVLIGHEGHPEVEGTKGRISGIVHLVSSAKDVAKLNVRNPDAMAYITQTTLSVDDTRAVIEALQQRFPKIVGPDVRDICYATQNRQSAVRALAQQSDVIIVVGAQNSSNSNRLREIGEESGVPSYLIDDADALEPSWFDEAGCIGITAGASAPEALVQEIIMRLGDFGEVQVRALEGIRENVQFKLPDQLQELAS